MSKNPFLNSFAAIIYISLVATIMFYGPEMIREKEDIVLIPIALLSLFTLSAAVMGYLFLYQPLQLYLDGKKQAIDLFPQTLGIFGAITILLLAALFSGVLN